VRPFFTTIAIVITGASLPAPVAAPIAMKSNKS
jgi:hypothetical protein